MPTVERDQQTLLDWFSTDAGRFVTWLIRNWDNSYIVNTVLTLVVLMNTSDAHIISIDTKIESINTIALFFFSLAKSRDFFERHGFSTELVGYIGKIYLPLFYYSVTGTLIYLSLYEPYCVYNHLC